MYAAPLGRQCWLLSRLLAGSSAGLWARAVATRSPAALRAWFSWLWLSALLL
ncbi:hypothetical protein PABY_12780 [Pyrodictium abyssi]|uniref:Uncharacterized protein n=1 Tax=Pyrodictium abyssi TaxID=54256 RepID=A0ABM8IXU5_9CREN|nr:hypothetical protein PABY_12780 [Pyrodictium abyssi]